LSADASRREAFGVRGIPPLWGATEARDLAVSTVAPALAVQIQTNASILTWYGLAGVTYQTFYSTNLVHWAPYRAAIIGNHRPVQLLAPRSAASTVFFRVEAVY
jgi:hypothetical protein